MKIQVTLTVSDEDHKKIEQLFGSADADKYETIFAKAGADEFYAQATGEARPGSFSDWQLNRIYRLMRNGIGVQEAETLVANLFGLREKPAQSLVAKTLARYKLPLEPDLKNEIVKVLEQSAKWVKSKDKERWELELPPGVLQDEILEAAKKTNQPDTEKARGNVWRFPDETYQAVRVAYGLVKKSKK